MTLLEIYHEKWVLGLSGNWLAEILHFLDNVIKIALILRGNAPNTEYCHYQDKYPR